MFYLRKLKTMDIVQNNGQERVTSTHWIRGWVGSRASLDAVEKRKISCPCQELNPNFSAIQPIAHCYTN
jgi:hypothetical protein